MVLVDERLDVGDIDGAHSILQLVAAKLKIFSSKFRRNKLFSKWSRN